MLNSHQIVTYFILQFICIMLVLRDFTLITCLPNLAWLAERTVK